MIDTYQIYEQLRQSLGDKVAREVATVFAAIAADLQNTATKTDFHALRETVSELADAQRRTESRVGELADAQRRTESRVGELADAQRRTEESLQALTTRIDKVSNRVDNFAGHLFESQFRLKAGAYLGRTVRRTRIIDTRDLEEDLERVLNDQELGDVLRLDALVKAKTPEGQDLYLACEISCTADDYDIERARHRSALLRRAGLPCIGMVICESASEQDVQFAVTAGVPILRGAECHGFAEAVSRL